MKLSGCNIGLAITGSFCTFDKIIKTIDDLKNEGANVFPIFSYNAKKLDTRFYQAEDFFKKVEKKCNNKAITTVPEAEPIGPKAFIDVLVIAPCTGNTAAKLANGITDTPVLMAAKAHLRNGRPLVIAISTNDALGINLKNIGSLMVMKNVYFVPFYQDDCEKKPNSLIADTTGITDTICAAISGKQIQPLIRVKK